MDGGFDGGFYGGLMKPTSLRDIVKALLSLIKAGH